MITFTIPSIYDALDLIMTKYPNDFTNKNRVEIETLLDHCLEDISSDSEKFLTTLFIKAIKMFIGPGKIDENIYLKEFEITQIELFNILIEKFPFVKHSQRIVNHSIYHLAASRKELVLIDIGIGLGVQMVNLLEQFERSHLEKVSLIGIEPSMDALKKAESAISKLSNQVSYELNFIPINGLIEKLYFNELENTLADLSGDVVINASLALHHIQKLEQRQSVINSLFKLKPKAFYLVEPNVDHYEPELYKRFQNCYTHFAHVFEVIDKLQIAEKEKNGLKLFFGREIEDIIGRDNNERFEKHEPAYRWVEKLILAGFKIHDGFYQANNHVLDGMRLTMKRNGYLAFQCRSETVLAVMCAIS